MYIFTKISAIHDKLRDGEIICVTCSDINLGECVLLTAPPRVKDATFRLIQTSPVVKILEQSGDMDFCIRFQTESGSIYEIKEIV